MVPQLLARAVQAAPGVVDKVIVRDPLSCEGMGGFAAFVVFVFVVIVTVYFFAARNAARPVRTSHGSARWGTGDDAARAGLLLPKGQPGGLMLGRFTSGVSRKLDPRLRVSESHILTVSPTGGGKGIGCAIPHLLEYPGS